MKLGVPYEEGLNKNRYIARTFIMPGQQKRKKNVRKKLNPCRGVFEGKNVMLVDDSIVRGTTSEQIVQMVRAAGAKKVFFCSASPAIRYPNVYGIDMPVQAELIAFGRDELEIAKAISADWVVYQDMDDLTEAVKECNPAIEKFDTSCFNGVYVTGDIDDAYFQALRDHRSDSILSVDATSGDVDSMARKGAAAAAGQSGSGSGSGSGSTSPPNGAKGGGGLVRKVNEMRIDEGDEEERGEDGPGAGAGAAAANGKAHGTGNGDILAVDGVEAAKSSGQLGQARPRGRMIGARPAGAGDAADALAAVDPQNHPNGLRNEDMERLRDRFSGWV
jgi:hypothetical protein